MIQTARLRTSTRRRGLVTGCGRTDRTKDAPIAMIQQSGRDDRRESARDGHASRSRIGASARGSRRRGPATQSAGRSPSERTPQRGSARRERERRAAYPQNGASRIRLGAARKREPPDEGEDDDQETPDRTPRRCLRRLRNRESRATTRDFATASPPGPASHRRESVRQPHSSPRHHRIRPSSRARSTARVTSSRSASSPR